MYRHGPLYQEIQTPCPREVLNERFNEDFLFYKMYRHGPLHRMQAPWPSRVFVVGNNEDILVFLNVQTWTPAFSSPKMQVPRPSSGLVNLKNNIGSHTFRGKK